MIKSTTESRIITSVVIFVLLLGQQRANAAAPAPAVSSSVNIATFPAMQLRGYGTVEGSLKRELAGTILEIACEDADKAKLLQAKYLSDFQLLPGVREIKGPDFTSYQADDQGVVAAFCEGSKIVILSSQSAAGLASLVKQIKPAGASTAQAQVPMWLDRWDKFGFRFYYREWERPKDTTDQNYDFTNEFDYARDHGRIGLAFWNGHLASDSAEGMMSTGYNGWATAEARKRNLPIGSNIVGRGGFEPSWIVNRYREQNQLKMPGFTGNLHSLMDTWIGGMGAISWDATTAKDAMLGLYQQSIRDSAADPNTVSFMEIHGETRHGDQDVFLEYGPVTDANYRLYLKEKYAAPQKVASRWGMTIQSWDDVRVPELVHFVGGGPGSLDVGGMWRIGYEELAQQGPVAYNWYNQRTAPKSKPALEEWFKPDFDDSSWAEIPGAGHDRQMFLQRRPAVFRRTFDVPADWKTKNPRLWLYVWDLNLATNEEVRVVVNGRDAGRSKITGPMHRCAMDVSDLVQAGKNSLAIRVPQGYIAYKSYLSPVEPREYPNLGDGLNAQWVDWVSFTEWSRMQAIKRGVEMIRQVAPNHQITLASPNAYVDGLKKLASAYGAEFHDTGYMGWTWDDQLPLLMRGADLPMSLEAGEPAVDLNDFKKQIGLWQTEGIQGADYYIHIGSVLWRPEILAEFEKQRVQLQTLGKLHVPKAEIATLGSNVVGSLLAFPWGISSNRVSSVRWNWSGLADLRRRYPFDSLTQSSFAGGDAKAYRVIIDSNVSLMDERLLSDIEQWVRDGGTFIAISETGRHTPERFDAWPIERLTGYKVTRIDNVSTGKNANNPGTLKSAPGQTILGVDWNGVSAGGLRLEKTAPDAQDLLLWNDGGTAVGMRPLGKGCVVLLGVNLPAANPNPQAESDKSAPAKRFRDLLDAFLHWRDVKPEPGNLIPANSSVLLCHSVSNNGLYDAWTVWNSSAKEAQTVSVQIKTGRQPPFYIDVRDGKQTSLAQPQIDNIALEPLGARMFLTPRDQITQAPADWFDLQRKWWRGTTRPEPKQLPVPTPRWVRDLTQDWKFQTLDDTTDATPMLAAEFDDKSWASRSLGIWNVKDEGQGKGRAVFRKTFTVPADWNDGLISIWLASWGSHSFVGQGRVWMDGKEVKPMDNAGYVVNPSPTLKAGTIHMLAVEAKSQGVLAGLRGECWISYEPKPLKKLDLSGQWQASKDALRYDASFSLPGKFTMPFLKRTIKIPEEYRGKDVVLTVDGDRRLVNILINGRLVRRHHHSLTARGSLNVTPFIRFGEENEIEIAHWNGGAPIVQWNDAGTADTVREVFLGIHDHATFP